MSRRALALTTATFALAAMAVAIRTKQVEEQNPPSGKFVEVDGLRLHYLEAGSGEPIVFLHGNGSLIQDFVTSDLVRLVAQTHRVIVFDRPGYGHSQRPRNRVWTPAAQADLLARAAAKLGVGKVRVLGHSWGTLVAVEWALRHPESVVGLTLMSGYYFPTLRLDFVLASGPALPVAGDLLRYTITPVVARLLWPVLLRKLFGPAKTSERFNSIPRALFLAPHALRASAEEAALMIPSVAALVARYADLKLPVLIVTGDADRMVNPRHQSYRLDQLLPNSTLMVLPGAGHMIHHTEARKIAEAIVKRPDVRHAAA
jgi:pimeloyl-ACP methyl ester carboxylesterase